MRYFLFFVVICCFFFCFIKDLWLNVILIMVDDMGSECLLINGVIEYKIFNLDCFVWIGM